MISFSPIVLPSPNRRKDIQLRVSAPSTGDSLPIILLSHGHGRSNYLSSSEGYGPLVDFWAGHGFAVIQPTHLSSKFLSIALTDENYRELFLDSRAQDMIQILDQLDAVEKAVPFLNGRLDKSRVAVAGHSLGAFTASVLLGAENTDPRNGQVSRFFDPRIKAGVVLGGTGTGGSSLSDAGRQLVPFYGPDFSTMKTPALVVWGDEDVSPHLTIRGADWHADAYSLGPSPKASFCVKGGHHGFGGISGWDAGETQDESPERLASVQRLSWAYLRSQLYEGDKSWDVAVEDLAKLDLGTVQTK